MMGRIGIALLVTATSAAWALPAQAKKKPPADPGEQLCEAAWNASYGKVELKQTVSGSGVVLRDNLSIVRAVPGSGSGATISFNDSVLRTGGSTSTWRSQYLSLDGSWSKGKNQRLVIAMPGGDPMVLGAEYGTNVVSVSDEQLARLLAARQRLTYRLVKVDREGRETAQLADGWFDLTALADLPGAGLPHSAEQVRSLMQTARAGASPPCVSAAVAERNSQDEGEPVRKWLTFDCSEVWKSPLGSFELYEDRFIWIAEPRGGVGFDVRANVRLLPRTDLTRFISDPDDARRFGTFSVKFDPGEWSLNFNPKAPKEQWERQTGEIRRGRYVARHTLSNAGTGFFWGQMNQVLQGEGDIVASARDAVTGTSVSAALPWGEVEAAEAELRKGQQRLIEREADPAARCKAKVEVEYGTEEIIVT